jgi:hypothetical protein
MPVPGGTQKGTNRRKLVPAGLYHVSLTFLEEERLTLYDVDG